MTFEEYVAGRTVCVVGPAPLDEPLDDLIESHDIVYRAGRHIPRPGYGTRTDVVYLNSHQGRTILADESASWSAHMQAADWWVFKNLSGWRPSGNYRRAMRPRKMNPNAVTGILWDLIHFEPSSITVVGTDLYAGGPQRAYYDGYDMHALTVQAEAFLNHKPFDQMRVHRQIVQTGKVVGDDRYLKAVSMTDDEYRTVVDSWRAVLEEAAE